MALWRRHICSNEAGGHDAPCVQGIAQRQFRACTPVLRPVPREPKSGGSLLGWRR